MYEVNSVGTGILAKERCRDVNCDECQNRLQEYVDNEVPSADRAAMDAHIASCDECARLHRRVAQFTTTMVKAVSGIRPGADFSSKVIARYEESQADLKGVPDKASERMPIRTYPAWPFVVGIVVVVALGAWLLFSGPERHAIGSINQGQEWARVLTFEKGAWQDSPGAQIVHSGEMVSVEEPGTIVRIDCTSAGGVQIYLQSPCKMQFMKEGTRLVAAPWAESPGRLYVKTSARVNPDTDIKAVRIKFGQAYVEVACAQKNAVGVAVGEDNELMASVRNGSAKVGNRRNSETLAKGYATSIPQKGARAPITQTKPGAFDWVDSE